MSWLEYIGIPFIAYQHRDPYQPLYYPNRANEAGAYLQFLLDFYNCLPKVHTRACDRLQELPSVKSALYWQDACIWETCTQLVATETGVMLHELFPHQQQPSLTSLPALPGDSLHPRPPVGELAQRRHAFHPDHSTVGEGPVHRHQQASPPAAAQLDS